MKGNNIMKRFLSALLAGVIVLAAPTGIFPIAFAASENEGARLTPEAVGQMDITLPVYLLKDKNWTKTTTKVTASTISDIEIIYQSDQDLSGNYRINFDISKLLPEDYYFCFGVDVYGDLISKGAPSNNPNRFLDIRIDQYGKPSYKLIDIWGIDKSLIDQAFDSSLNNGAAAPLGFSKINSDCRDTIRLPLKKSSVSDITVELDPSYRTPNDVYMKVNVEQYRADLEQYEGERIYFLTDEDFPNDGIAKEPYEKRMLSNILIPSGKLVWDHIDIEVAYYIQSTACKTALKPGNSSSNTGSSSSGASGSSSQLKPNANPAKYGDLYRLYNSLTGEHFYTANTLEKNHLVQSGWKFESQEWKAPDHSNTPVYRVCNPNTGDHHFTKDLNEYQALVRLGWNAEGLAWFSDDSEGIPVYRLYNPNAKIGSHHYTVSVDELVSLVSLGWKSEGIAWHGVKS